MTKTEENQNSAATPAATAAPVPGVVDLSIETSKLRLFPQLGTVRDPVTGKPVPTFWQVLKSPQNAGVFRSLIVFTLLMFAVPLTAFFGTQHYLETRNTASDNDLSANQRLTYSGIAAILGLYLVLAVFVVYAFCIDRGSSQVADGAGAQDDGDPAVKQEEDSPNTSSSSASSVSIAASPTRGDHQPRLRR